MSGFVVSVFAGLIALSALVFDGARLLAHRAALDDHAANAARAAAQEIVDIRLGNERIDPEAGSLAAHRYLASHDLVGSVKIDGLSVEVTVVRTVPVTLLSLVGVDEQVVATTRAVRVVDE
nr:hypothetical protein [Acidobacteriota bacterium]